MFILSSAARWFNTWSIPLFWGCQKSALIAILKAWLLSAPKYPNSYILHASHIFVMSVVRNFKFGTWTYHSKSHPADDKKYFPKGAWSGSRVQFLYCGLRKFRHSKSSMYGWYPQLDRRRFVYDTYRTIEGTRSRHGWVHMFITQRPSVTLQLHNFDLFRTCRTSSFCTVAWQLARLPTDTTHRAVPWR